jgi:hypothetical protein
MNGHMYLVIVDAYSKFPEVRKMANTTSTATISVLREMFSRYGLPEILVSDNGPQFRSDEFEEFCKKNGILHRTSAVHKPSTNGQAEIVVKLLKTAIKQAAETNTDVDTAINRYLLIHRTTPHSTTGESPSTMLMGRRLRTKHDLLMPSVKGNVERQQQLVIDRTATRNVRSFAEGDCVRVRNYGIGCKWKYGVITEVLGSRHYNIDVDGNIWKRHVDQIIRSSSENEQHPAHVDNDEYVPTVVPPSVSLPVLPAATPPVSPTIAPTAENTTSSSTPEVKETVDSSIVQNDRPEKSRYSLRENRKTPAYLDDYTQ